MHEGFVLPTGTSHRPNLKKIDMVLLTSILTSEDNLFGNIKGGRIQFSVKIGSPWVKL